MFFPPFFSPFIYPQLFYVVTSLFHKYNLFDRLKIGKEAFICFIKATEAGYMSENPYHNSTHGTLKRVVWYFEEGGVVL